MACVTHVQPSRSGSEAGSLGLSDPGGLARLNDVGPRALPLLIMQAVFAEAPSGHQRRVSSSAEPVIVMNPAPPMGCCLACA